MWVNLALGFSNFIYIFSSCRDDEDWCCFDILDMHCKFALHLFIFVNGVLGATVTRKLDKIINNFGGIDIQ